VRLCAFSNQFTKNTDDAREVVQELFVYLWENRDKIKEVQSVQSYVYAALRYNSIRKFKSRSTGVIEIAEVPENDLAVNFQNDLEFAELQEAILETIDSLPPQCQKIFKLSRFEKQTYREIAGRLNISPKTVEAQMRKALQILQKALDNFLLAFIFFLFR
jgi:RNA polymerase sigma-70 factor (ECF subfamily)